MLYTIVVSGVDYSSVAEALEAEEMNEAVNVINRLWPRAEIKITPKKEN